MRNLLLFLIFGAIMYVGWQLQCINNQVDSAGKWVQEVKKTFIGE